MPPVLGRPVKVNKPKMPGNRNLFFWNTAIKNL
jgi:hypothetical protein